MSTLPTLDDVHRLAFSSERYGKHQDIPGSRVSSVVRGTALEDDDNEDEHELYGYSKDSERGVPWGEDGALERMTRLPVDILYEVFSHLHPSDVLSLSRTTKKLRSILYEEHARGVWRSSLGGVRALPACPPDMSEMQYASLAFDDWCHFCLASGRVDIAWVCRVRCCQNCLKQQFISEDELDLWLPENLYIENPDSVFPFFMLSQKRPAGRNKPMYYLPRAREYLHELDFLNGDVALAKWSQEKKAKQTARVQHAAQCEYWNTHWAFRASSRPTTSYLWELALVLWLTLLLIGLWKDKVVEIAGRF